jgi:Cys-tRNA(Pro) deacylase
MGTRATAWLDANGVAYSLHPYEYEARGGTRVSSAKLGVDEHHVIKTLVFEDDARQPFIVLMHGDKEVSVKALARHLAVKQVQPCKPDVAERHTGYLVGGTSPFGTKKPLAVCAESTMLSLPRLFINAGQRGLLVALDGPTLKRILKPREVQCAQ